MSPVIITLLVLLGVGLLLALWLMYIYNGLVVAGNRFKNAFAQIDVQLKRRYDLIPNLVEAVKGYMGHERETLDAVIKARNSAMAAEQKVAANPSDPAAMGELNQAEAQLGGILGRLARPAGRAQRHHRDAGALLAFAPGEQAAQAAVGQSGQSVG